MSCNDIEVINDKQTIEIANQQEIVQLTTEDNIAVDITDQRDVVDLKDEITNIIEVVNVNGAFVGVGDHYEFFTPTLGQTVFTLGNILIPEQILISKVFINGQTIALTTCYTISGSQLTVILPYSLDTGDILEIYY